MNNFENTGFLPPTQKYLQYPDPSQNEPFNKATHPANKPIISKHIFAVDSRQRNYNFFPKSNEYTIDVPDRYRNITSIELKAAMLPRTEYNVNSNNKYIDFSIGDYLSQLKWVNYNLVTDKGQMITDGTYPFTISPPNDVSGTQATATATLQNSIITNINITDSGSGYIYSVPPIVTLFDNDNFNVIIGKQYQAVLREGQYVIGGNPEFVLNSTDSYSSYTPFKFINEIEASLSYCILNDPDTTYTATPNPSEYCYTRKSWIDTQTGGAPSGTSDYPLLFTVRLMSQYPNLDTYTLTSRSNNINQYETNACNYNRMFFSNVLIVKMSGGASPPAAPFSDGASPPVTYTILGYYQIPYSNTNDYIVYLEAPTWSSTQSWVGFTETSLIKFAKWELLFATGENNILNSSTLFGFNKKNYYEPTENETVTVNCLTTSSPTPGPTLVPKGLTYSTENDWYLVGDPEYVMLSFRPKWGGSQLSEADDRVDSNTDTNVNRIFACLIYDTVQPAVLQDLSSGNSMSSVNSLGITNNQGTNSFLNQDNTFSEVKQLGGNVGAQNTNFNKPPGQLKALKGYDFDKKIIEFTQPLSQLSQLSIRFTKFSKRISRTDEELYNFHGKEHLLMFEITCGDLMTGKRF